MKIISDDRSLYTFGKKSEGVQINQGHSYNKPYILICLLTSINT